MPMRDIIPGYAGDDRKARRKAITEDAVIWTMQKALFLKFHFTTSALAASKAFIRILTSLSAHFSISAMISA